MKVAVTGASGFIGSAVVARCRTDGIAVIGLSRQDRGAGRPGDHMVVDLGNVPRLAEALSGCDAVVHCAAKAHQNAASARPEDSAFADNAALMQAVVSACQLAGVRQLLLLSSIGVNGNRTVDRPFTENDLPAPVEAYARSKLRCEELLAAACSSSELTYTIVRPPLVYGPRAPGNFGALARAIRQGIPLPLGGIHHNRRSLIGLDNLVDIIIRSLHHPAAMNRLFLVADGEDLSTSRLVQLLAQACGRSPKRILPVPPHMLLRLASLAKKQQSAAKLIDSLQIDISRVTTALDWRPPVSVAEGLRRAMTRT